MRTGIKSCLAGQAKDKTIQLATIHKTTPWLALVWIPYYEQRLDAKDTKQRVKCKLRPLSVSFMMPQIKSKNCYNLISSFVFYIKHNLFEHFGRWKTWLGSDIAWPLPSLHSRPRLHSYLIIEYRKIYVSWIEWHWFFWTNTGRSWGVF